ncbi:glycine betaine transporter OpuD-like isoform X1 [Clytia hemisphaerica]|uniref:Uncharacterized protein n=1 Tax=Clytia hemisphaerica TaxID=252671 RepID=A0A7M5TRC1_9CNID
MDSLEEARDDKYNEKHIQDRKTWFISECWQVKGKFGRIRFQFNPLSTFLGAFVLWAILIWAITDEETSIEKINVARRWITDKCTWFYIGSQFIWVILIIYIYFKYGHIKLGLSTDQVEYGDFDYFAMIFTTGICNGLFYDGASAPIAGYNDSTDNLLIYKGKSNHITQAQNSLNVVMFHWGFHGFSVYVLPCLLLSVLCYRKGLPLTMRSCLYPVFGKKILGRLGDVIDSISIICMGFGVATSFLLGAIMVVVGLQPIFPELADNQTTRLIALWAVSIMSMFSATSGIKLGIRRMSQLCFLTGALFTLIVAFSDNLWYLLNLAVQSIGYYFQYLISTATFTSAFVQQRNYPDGKQQEFDWMHKNTIFYWGWWLGWAPLVSIFATRISKGRTIKSVIEIAFIIPSFVNFIWFVVVGGVSIDMENQAISMRLHCGMNKTTRDALGAPDWLHSLGCIDEDKRFYMVIEKYEDIKIILQIIALMLTLLYFITSFDSAALVMGTISSNGLEEPPLIQRIFWCITIAACTSALIVYTEFTDRADVNAFAILAGLPFAVLMCFCAISLWRLLKMEPYWFYNEIAHWEMIYGHIDDIQILKKVLLAIVAPWYYLGQMAIKLSLNHHGDKNGNHVGEGHPPVSAQTTGSPPLSNQKRFFAYFKFAFPFYLWIVLLLLQIRYQNINSVGWAVFVGFLVLSSRIRTALRRQYRIQGNVFEDIAIMAIFPLTVVQMYRQVIFGERSIETGDTTEMKNNPSTKTNRGQRNLAYIHESFSPESPPIYQSGEDFLAA